MQCTQPVFPILSIFICFSFNIVECISSHCKNVTTSSKDPSECPSDIDLVVLILSNGPSEAQQSLEILRRIVKPCTDVGDSRSNITFITNVTEGSCQSSTYQFNNLATFGGFFATFSEVNDKTSDIPGAIQQTLEKRNLEMVYASFYTPAVYILTDITCREMNVSYPHTREMIHSQKVSEMVRNLGVPVRIFLVNNQEDDVTLCKLDLFQMDSNGFLSYETKVTQNEPGLEEKYGFCGNSSAYATTSLYPTTTKKTPRSKKHILYWVLGAVGVAIVLAFLICLASMVRRIFFPQFNPWDTPNTGYNKEDAPSKNMVRKHNSYAGAPINVVFREKQPDNDIWEVVPSQLLITEQRLGSGAYAVVHKAVLSGVPPVYKKFPALQLANILSETENVVAAKTPKRNASLEEKLEFTQEIEFMKRLDYYPHLLSMIGCSSSVQYPALLTEYCALGDLLHLVRALDGSSEAVPQICFGDLVPLCWQMSDALAYLCARKIIHRDVAARNVLVTTDKMAKLSDFGLCRTDEQMMYTTRGGKLPIKWMAPESLDYAVFSAKTDVWSYGILLYEVFSFGKTPFITVDADTLSEHLKEGNRMSIPERTPSKVERSACKDVTTGPKWSSCPTTIDLIVLILAYEHDGMPEFVKILSQMVAPCNLVSEKSGAPLSHITFVTSVTKDLFRSETFLFSQLPQYGDYYSIFPPSNDIDHDILGAISQTLNNRTTALGSIFYTPAIYVLTNITCTQLNAAYPYTMKMLNFSNTTETFRNLTMPVRLLFTKSEGSNEDDIAPCRLHDFKTVSDGYFDYEHNLSSDQLTLGENYGFCDFSPSSESSTRRQSTRPTTTTTISRTTTTTQTSSRTSTSTSTTTTTTTPREETKSTDRQSATSVVPMPPWGSLPTTKKPRDQKILYGVLGGFGALFVAVVLVCGMCVIRRLCFPESWDRALFPAIVRNRALFRKFERDPAEYIATQRRSKHNSYAEPPIETIYREKQKDTDVWEVVPSQLLITEQRLGSGAYAVVHKAVLSGVPPVYKKFPALQLANILSETENTVAAKTPKKHANIEERFEFLQEVEFMKRLDYYPHLVSMIGCSSSVQYPVLLTEYCALGDLLHLVRALDGSSEAPEINFSDLIPICWQMSDALAYLCARKIIHRDVAARNVLVTKEKMAKLSDFGLCRTDEQMMYTTRGGKLPIKWMAPESLDYAVFSAKTDVWSYGILLYEVFSFGKTPFITVDADILAVHLREGNRLSIPEKTPPVISDLMRECWMERPEDRPDITVIRENLYSMMEAESDGYGYLTFSKNYYDVFKEKLYNMDKVYEV